MSFLLGGGAVFAFVSWAGKQFIRNTVKENLAPILQPFIKQLDNIELKASKRDETLVTMGLQLAGIKATAEASDRALTSFIPAVSRLSEISARYDARLESNSERLGRLETRMNDAANER